MATKILRPNATGDECLISYEIGAACPNHWQNVNTVIPVGDAPCVLEATDDVNYYRDLYHISALSGTGTIRSVTVYARCRRFDIPVIPRASLKIALKTGATVDESAPITLTESYVNYSKVWTTNPETGVAWTLTDIATLQIGLALRNADGLAATEDDSICVQVFAVIDYSRWIQQSLRRRPRCILLRP